MIPNQEHRSQTEPAEVRSATMTGTHNHSRAAGLAGGRRRARRVLALAGMVALLGLLGGALASSHLTSSVSDFDATGSAVVLAQHQLQRATGADPEEGYEVVVRTPAAIGASSPLPARVATVV